MRVITRIGSLLGSSRITTTPHFTFASKLSSINREGLLELRNSQTLQLKLARMNEQQENVEIVDLQLPSNITVGELREEVKTKLEAEEHQCKVFAEELIAIEDSAPVQALLNRSFFMRFHNSEQMISIKVTGQLFQTPLPPTEGEIAQDLEELQLPVLTQRQLEAFLKRIDIWLAAKYGPVAGNARQKLKSKQIQDILVQAAVDPQVIPGYLRPLQAKWQQVYWQTVQLREKKEQAMRICEKMAKLRMSAGLGLIVANTAFIWSGTYVFFSWDIIEPIAYFTTSFASIVMFSQAMRMGQPFSLDAYKTWLMERHMQTACQKVGLDLKELENKEHALRELESYIKDILISKL